MSSQSQIDANRRNAQLSTGPRTEEGKAAVSLNAFKHGYRAQVYRSSDLDPSRFDALYAALREQYDPRTVTEELYVERIAITQNKLALMEGVEEEHERQGELEKLPPVREHQRRLEASFDRAVTMLHKVQKERKAGEARAEAGAQSQARAEAAQAVAEIERKMAILSMIRTPAQVMAFEEAEAAGAEPDTEPVIGPGADEPAAS